MTIENSETGYTYAVCAAQRRARGQIWLLVAGVTGPATYAAAKWVHRMATTMDDAESGKPSKMFWNIVRSNAVMVTESSRVLGRFVPTARNEPASTLFSDSGFEPIGDGEWLLEEGAPRPLEPEWFAVSDR